MKKFIVIENGKFFIVNAESEEALIELLTKREGTFMIFTWNTIHFCPIKTLKKGEFTDLDNK